MALSATFDYSVLGSDIMTGAFEDIQSTQSDGTVANADQIIGLRELNLLVKGLMGKPGLAPGLKRWSRSYVYMFLRKNKNIYTFGQTAQTTDKAARSGYNSTTTSVSAISGQPVIMGSGTILSWPTGQSGGVIATTDIIGVILDSGDFQWSTVTVSGNTLTLGTNLTGNVSAGAQVFSYPALSFVDLPLDFLTCKRRDINGIDYDMTKMLDIQDYEGITNKNITTTPVQWFYEKQRVTGNLYLNGFPATLTDVIRAAVLYPLDDMSAVSNDIAFPQQWYDYLTRLLAKKLSPKYGKQWTDTMEQNLTSAFAEATAVDPETVGDYFQPGREYGSQNYSNG
jgi:hypothetical protein